MRKEPRVLVCVTGQKSCERLIHDGAEIAAELGAELSVVHVAKMGSNFLGSPSESQALEYLFDISKSHHADMMLLRNDDVVHTIAAHARKIGATVIVLGSGMQSGGGGRISRALQNALPDVEIHVRVGIDE